MTSLQTLSLVGTPLAALTIAALVLWINRREGTKRG